MSCTSVRPYEVTDEPVGHLELFLGCCTTVGGGRWGRRCRPPSGSCCRRPRLGRGQSCWCRRCWSPSLLFALPINAHQPPPPADPGGLDLGDRAGGLGDRDRHGRQPKPPAICVASWATWAVVTGVLGTDWSMHRRGQHGRGPVSAVLLAVVPALWGSVRGADQGCGASSSPTGSTGAVALELYAWRSPSRHAVQQSSFRAGALTASLPAMAIAERWSASVLARGGAAKTVVRLATQAAVLRSSPFVAVVASRVVRRAPGRNHRAVG